MTVPYRRPANRTYAKPVKAPPRRLTPDELTDAEAMLKRGLTYHEVARKLRCSDSAIRHRFPGYNQPKGQW